MVYPDFSFEEKCWEKGFEWVIGVDEVGRGAFAGPVIAAAAAMRMQNAKCKMQNGDGKLFKEILKLGINDSKKLSAKKREKLDPEIKKYFHATIGVCEVPFINSFGIVKATEKAIRQAIIKLFFEIANQKTGTKLLSSDFIKTLRAYLLLDAFHVKYVPIIGLNHQQAIIHGDQKSISIAAASIVAKVHRDQFMRVLSTKYVQYRWDENKGYGTSDHREAIKKHGICQMHRKQFVKSWLS